MPTPIDPADVPPEYTQVEFHTEAEFAALCEGCDFWEGEDHRRIFIKHSPDGSIPRDNVTWIAFVKKRN